MSELVQVLVSLEARALAGRLFTYRVPPELAADIAPGVPVKIPFGRQQSVRGFVLGPGESPGEGVTLRDLQAVVDPVPRFTQAQFDLLQWLAEQTATPLPQVVACALPAPLLKPKPSKPRKQKTAPPAWATVGAAARQELTDGQSAVVDTILASEEQPGEPWLIHGVTGSGKTSVYLALAEATLEAGRNVLILLPEIALTSQVARRFVARFGAEHVALWHSNLADGERVDTWHKLRTGECRLLIGARSAVFCPIQNLGLIVIDESHDSSYKQDAPPPKYHAIGFAAEMARRAGARLVCGSATPTVSAYARATRKGRLLTLPERFGGRPLAPVTLVDMKQERANGQGGILSRPLKDALAETLTAGEQAIVLINRRGYYTLLSCADCDEVFLCPQCSVGLTYHRPSNTVRCHYCGIELPTPQFCLHCAGSNLVRTGVGTQRVEDELTKALPEARILRLDGDVLGRRHAAEEVLAAFGSGEADILVGTQMVAKGLDLANVTLVGVVGADSSLMLPDFLASERTFQLLTQVAGRAGRGERPGRVFFQTLVPSHPVIQWAAQQDYPSFYEDEVVKREMTGFPPFSQLIRWVASSETEAMARQFLAQGVEALIAQTAAAGLAERVEVIGPASCVLSRIQNRYRFHALVKNRAGRRGHQLVTQVFQALAPPPEVWSILDVDAQTLL